MAWYAAIRGLLPLLGAYPTVSLFTFVTHISVSARVLGFFICFDAVIKRRIKFPNPERKSRTESAGAVLSQSATQVSGVVYLCLALLVPWNGSFIFHKAPQRDKGALKKKGGVMVLCF